MLNPIPKSNLFATPESLDDLADRINSIGNKKEVALAWQVAMMTLNLSHELVEQLHIKETV